ncbi:MAG: RtcB family protein [Phycisphaeraceae bacterium]|nr:RtcB family protein [Phycisphaerales bacterium]MCB9860442.1 RtcB family protein [Phycisphaeraceae bacterium]
MGRKRKKHHAAARSDTDSPVETLAQMDPCPHRIWGEVGVDFDQNSLDQLRNACSLPVSVAGALMPDAHVGYGLPIGGVLATRDAVIPYAVGVDIACRMKMTVLDLNSKQIDHPHVRDRLAGAIEAETRFGVGGAFRGYDRHQHAVMDDAAWDASHVTRKLKNKAWTQLGTSGSGNHFVEFGLLTVFENAPRRVSQQSEAGSHAKWDLEPGTYVAFMSHSGSRGSGASICQHYSDIARANHPELPKQFSYLAWLDMKSDAGQEYWTAMNLMGRYAAANHECIHRAIAKHLGAKVIADVENHHNFAWLETHEVDGVQEEVVVHRKGATPAGDGVMGIIPGTMATPGYVVVGAGSSDSLRSSSHGAGRVLSRTKAREKFRFGAVRGMLAKQGITVLSAGADESPGAYKDIEQVMAQQVDLVTPVARFDPKIVKMAPEGERAED